MLRTNSGGSQQFRARLVSQCTLVKLRASLNGKGLSDGPRTFAALIGRSSSPLFIDYVLEVFGLPARVIGGMWADVLPALDIAGVRMLFLVALFWSSGQFRWPCRTQVLAGSHVRCLILRSRGTCSRSSASAQSMAQAFAALPLATWQPAFQFCAVRFSVSHGFLHRSGHVTNAAGKQQFRRALQPIDGSEHRFGGQAALRRRPLLFLRFEALLAEVPR